MLSFAVYENGEPAAKVNLTGAYVVGSDDVPLRSEITFSDGVITCAKRTAGPAGLALLWDVEGVGTVLLETARVQERPEPYVLTLELARGRLMRIQQKTEDWGMLGFDEVADISERVTRARDLFIDALKADNVAQTSLLGDQALTTAVQASESLAAYHSCVLFDRRKQSGLPKDAFGCSAGIDKPTENVQERLAATFDFVTVPISWRTIEPREQAYDWDLLDAWVEAASSRSIPIRGSSLLSFNQANVPDWLYIWEHDFDTIRDLAFEHVRRVINRYGQHVQTWSVVCGLHAINGFTFNFEQLMELTRMAAALTKQIAPRSQTIIELVAPWGEYYAKNQRTIPPLLYADMAVQSGINFDAFGLQFQFGAGSDGTFVRDMFQVSSLLDQFAKLGKPLHITVAQVPSGTKTVRNNLADADVSPIAGGQWHGPWSEEIQADWFEQFVKVAFCRPFVESISWGALVDQQNVPVPHGGLLRPDGQPKVAYDRLTAIRASAWTKHAPSKTKR